MQQRRIGTCGGSGFGSSATGSGFGLIVFVPSSSFCRNGIATTTPMPDAAKSTKMPAMRIAHIIHQARIRGVPSS